MTRWAAFAGLAGALVLTLLLLAHATRRLVPLQGDGPPRAGDVHDEEPAGYEDGSNGGHIGGDGIDAGNGGTAVGDEATGVSDDGTDAGDDGTDVGEDGFDVGGDGTDVTDGMSDGRVDTTAFAVDGRSPRAGADTAGRERASPVIERPTGASSPDEGAAADPGRTADSGPPPVESLSPSALVLNVGLTQGLLAAVLVGGVVVFSVPPAALGIAVPTHGEVAVGAAVGVGLYLVNELGSAAAGRLGVAHEEHLREVLAPSSAAGWAALLVVALPLVAGFEELLFRGALVGALALGFDLSPWLLAVASSAAFGVGHGAQGAGGVLVTGVLGMALAATFIWTGSLAAVVLAHYLVNALEFVVHEALGVEWAEVA